MLLPSDLIDVTAVAGILGISRSTVTRQAKAGTLPALTQLAGGVLVFDRNDIQAAAEQ